MKDLFLRNLVEALILFPGAALAYLPLRNRLRTEKRYLVPAVCAILFAASASTAWFSALFGVDNDVFLLPLILLCFGLFCLTANAPLPEKCFCFLNAVIQVQYVTMYTVYLAAPWEDDASAFTVRSGLVCLGLGILSVLLYYHTLTVELPELLEDERLTGNQWSLLSVSLVLIAALFYWSMPEDVSLIGVGRIRPVMLVLLLFFPLFCILICHLCWRVASRLTEAARIAEENHLLQMERKRYESLREYMDETRAMRHDFRQHLVVLNRLSEDGRIDELQAYVRQLTKETAVSGRQSFCANPAADALAARYADLAAVLGVKIEWRLELPRELPVREADFCSILGNLLENAVRAAGEEPPENRRVRAIGRMLSDAMMGLSVENPCSRKIPMKNGLPVSDREGHGIGLASVSATVHRYGGSLDIKNEDGLFSVNILLCFPDPAKRKEGTGDV